MPELELFPELVGSSRNRLSLIPIGVVMLFPDEPDWRDWAGNGGIVEFFQRDWRPDDALNADIIASLQMRHTAPSWNQIQERAHRNITHGAVASALVLDALTLPGGGGGLTAIKSRLQERLSKAGGHFKKFSQSKIDNISWRRFGPVAHLYLAHVLVGASRGGEPYPFPCTTEDIPPFLKTAESIRIEAERTPLRQRAGTLLDPKRTWKVPQDCLGEAPSLWPLNH